jgi:hypothetical protein
MKYLMISVEDIENNSSLKRLVEAQAHFVDFTMNCYFIHGADKMCTWFALKFPQSQYVTIDITVL